MNKVLALFYGVWSLLVLGYILNATFGVLVAEVTWVLRPLPLVLLAGWVFYRWPKDQGRKLALILGLLLFAAGDALVFQEGYYSASLLLYMCGFLAYTIWVARGVSMDHFRWMALIPVICLALLGGYWLWWTPSLLREGMVLYVVLVTACVICVILFPRLHWVALPGVVLLALSQALMGYHNYLGDVPHATVVIMLLYYAGHFGLAHGPLWYQVPDESPLGYVTPGEVGR